MRVQLLTLFICLLGYLILLFAVKGNKQRFGQNNVRAVYCAFCGIVLSLQSGLRWDNIGDDTRTYVRRFLSDVDSSWQSIFYNFRKVYIEDEGVDAGFSVFNKIVSYISEDPQVYLMIVAIVFFSAFMYFMYKNTNRCSDVLLAILLYESLFYYFFSITGIRQTLATACCMIGFEYIKSRKLLKFLACIAVGTVLHKSCLLFLPFYWIGNLKNCRQLLVIVVVLFPIMTVSSSNFAYQLALLSGSERYIYYSYESTVGAQNFLLFLFSAIFCVFYNYKDAISQDLKRRYIFNALSLSIFFAPLTFTSANLLRVVQYYDIFLLPAIGFTFNGANKPGILKTAKIIFICALIYIIVKNNSLYKFYWEV